MKNKIGNFENMKLIDRIILNGKVGYIPTYDENFETIGIVNVIKRVTFAGEVLVDKNSGFALTKSMEDKLGWSNNYASIRFITGDTAIDPTKVDEIIIESYYGKAVAKYNHCYSDCTGYLWTEEGFIVGGHDIPQILKSHIDKYIHMEIEIYKYS